MGWGGSNPDCNNPWLIHFDGRMIFHIFANTTSFGSSSGTLLKAAADKFLWR